MAVQKKGSLWYPVISVRKSDGSGFTKRWISPGQRTYAAAEKIERKLRHQQDEGRDLFPERINFGEYVTEWLEGYRNRAPRTYKERAGLVRRYVGPMLQHRDLGEITADHIDALYQQLRAANLSEVTVSHVHKLLRQIFKGAVLKGKIQRDPTLLVEHPPKVRQRDHTIEDERGLIRIMQRIAGHPLEPAFLLAMYTGMRRKEIVSLKWSNLDLHRGRLTVVGGATTKNRPSERTIALSPKLVEVLRMLPVKREYVFVSGKTGGPYHPDSLTKAFSQLTGRRLHDQRHTHASLLLAHGVDLATISARLGHGDVSTTARIYSHLVPGRDTIAATRFDELVEKALGEDLENQQTDSEKIPSTEGWVSG